MDQYLVAAVALVVFAAFVALAYIFNEERKSRKPSDETRTGRNTIAKRPWRAF